jgi:hypothetical protein
MTMKFLEKYKKILHVMSLQDAIEFLEIFWFLIQVAAAMPCVFDELLESVSRELMELVQNKADIVQQDRNFFSLGFRLLRHKNRFLFPFRENNDKTRSQDCL